MELGYLFLLINRFMREVNDLDLPFLLVSLKPKEGQLLCWVGSSLHFGPSDALPQGGGNIPSSEQPLSSPTSKETSPCLLQAAAFATTNYFWVGLFPRTSTCLS